MNKETLNKIKYLAGMAAHLPADVTLEDEDAALKALHGELAADTVLELIALAERATSPVSVVTDKDAHDLVRRVEAHMERWVAENRCADSIKSSGEMVRYLLAAAAPHAQDNEGEKA